MSLLAILAGALLGCGQPGRAAEGDESGGEAVWASRLYGEPEVMKFKDGKLGAFTMQFDDSMISQAEVAIPLLNERGLVGTFFVNPGSERYQQHVEVWEKTCPQYGHELANHTWEHKGAQSMEEAEQQIGDSSRLAWRLYPGRSKLLPFARGGGTEWAISREQIQGLMMKYFLFRRPSRASISEEGETAGRITSYPRRAIEEQVWVPVHFHGIGGEWITTSREHFVELVDYLAANRDKLWVATCGDAYKYEKEREAVIRVSLGDATEDGFAVEIECDASKVETYGRPFEELYDQPLTVRNRVPESWLRFQVEQGGETRSYQTIEVEGQRHAQYDVRPGIGPARVTRVDPSAAAHS